MNGASRFLDACRGKPVDATPVWFMRQAGRSLPEYRALRERHTILDMCRTPDLAVEVTLQPVRRHGVDAAILFSDIVVPLQAMGIELAIEPGVGPVVAEPVRQAHDVDRLHALDIESGVPFVMETVRTLADELPVPLIGFAGAPFTLATYLVEGGPSKSHARTKSLMFSEPETWERLMERLAGATSDYLRAQISHGAAAVMLFDSWGGHLAPDDYRRHVMPWVERILRGLPEDVPRIVFGVTTGELLPLLAQTGAHVVGVDWRVPLDVARTRTGDSVALQGNLDPAACLAPWPVVRDRAADILRRGCGRGHIFNLGHGVLPDTDPEILTRLVEFVHEW